MSDRNPMTGGRVLTVGFAAIAAVTVWSGALRAQTAAELTQRVAVMQDSIKATQARLSAARVRHTLAPDDSIVANGVTVRFPSRALSERDRAAIRDGIADGRRTLTEDHGDAAARLLSGDRWNIFLSAQRNGRYETASLIATTAGPNAQRSIISVPLDATDIASFARTRAGQRLATQDSILNAFIGSGLTLHPQERAFYLAMRHLATSRSSVARHCADGRITACRTIFDTGASEQWFAPNDSIPNGGRPFPQWIHGTVVQVALEIGGPRAFERLATPASAEDAVSRLAEAAGTTPDSLLTVWSAKLREGTEANATPSIPLAASAAFWCGIFLLAATRRRPR